MSLIELLVLLIVAGIAGAIAEFLVGFSPGGFLVSIIIGVVGAYIGTWIARQIHLPELLMLNIGNEPFPVIWSILGSVVLLMILSLVRGSPRWRRRYVRRY